LTFLATIITTRLSIRRTAGKDVRLKTDIEALQGAVIKCRMGLSAAFAESQKSNKSGTTIEACTQLPRPTPAWKAEQIRCCNCHFNRQNSIGQEVLSRGIVSAGSSNGFPGIHGLGLHP